MGTSFELQVLGLCREDRRRLCQPIFTWMILIKRRKFDGGFECAIGNSGASSEPKLETCCRREKDGRGRFHPVSIVNRTDASQRVARLRSATRNRWGETETLSFPADILADLLHTFEMIEEFAPDLGKPHTQPMGKGLFEIRAKGHRPFTVLLSKWQRGRDIAIDRVKKKIWFNPRPNRRYHAYPKKQYIPPGKRSLEIIPDASDNRIICESRRTQSGNQFLTTRCQLSSDYFPGVSHQTTLNFL